MRKITRIAATASSFLAAATLLIALPGIAQSGGGTFEGRPGERMARRGPGSGAGPGQFAERRAGRLAEALDLTEEQIEAWEALRTEHDEATSVLREDLRANHEALRELIESDAADATAVGTAVLAGRDLRHELKSAREELDNSFAALLTSEQLAIYEALQEVRRGPRRRGPGRRHGRGPGSVG